MKGIRYLVLVLLLSLLSGMLLPGQTEPVGVDAEINAEEASDLAKDILNDIKDIDSQVSKLQNELAILKEQGQEASAEAIKLKGQVKDLTDRANTLGERYVKMIHIAKAYKAQTGTWRTVSFVAIGTTAVLAGVVTFMLISGAGGSR